MEDRFKYTNKLVITFVVLGFFLLVAFSALVLIKNKTLTNRVYYQTILDSAKGLSSKPPIFFKGFEIGRIDDFELVSETNDIQVRFYIYENYTDKIIKYAVISRVENLLLNTANEYEILLPKQDLIDQLEPLREGELVPFIDSELGQEYARQGQIAIKVDGIESILTSVNNILINIEKESDAEAGAIFEILDKFSKVADSFLSLAQQAEDEELVAEMKKTIIALQTLVDSTESTVAEAENAASSATRFLKNMDDVAAHTDSLVSTADKFFNQADKSAKHAGEVLKKYENPSEILSRASGNKIPGMIDNIDMNLLYLQDILKQVHLQREQLGMAIIVLNKTLSTFDKTLQGINNNPLFKEGIDPEKSANDSIEINEN